MLPSCRSRSFWTPAALYAGISLHVYQTFEKMLPENVLSATPAIGMHAGEVGGRQLNM